MENQFKQVATFQYSSEAYILKGKLESHNIEAFLHDNFTIDADPLISNAIGGVKVFVRQEEYDAATAILASINRFSVDNTGNSIVCPNCQNNEVDLFTTIKDPKSFFSFLFSLLITALPFYTKYKYKCNKCGHEFSEP